MKVRDRENRKFLTGFRDMVNFFTGNQDPVPPGGSPERVVFIMSMKTMLTLILVKHSSKQNGIMYMVP